MFSTANSLQFSSNLLETGFKRSIANRAPQVPRKEMQFFYSFGNSCSFPHPNLSSPRLLS